MKRSLWFFCLISLLIVVAGCSGKKQKVLYVFNWTDYISDDLIRQFEKENNCRIIYDTYDSNENMLSKVMKPTSSYDICVPSGDHVEIMWKKGLLEKIDRSKLKNWSSLDERILQKAASYDPENAYSIPYFWGFSGIVYNRDHVSDQQMQNASWEIFADSVYTGKDVVTMLNDQREIVGSALIYLGYDCNETSDSALAKAREVILRWDKNITQYDSDSYKNEIQDGTTWIAQSYNGDALQLMNENPRIGFVRPREGSTLWIDSMVIMKNAENKDLAYKFIDFLLKAENAKVNAEYVMYATPNKDAYNLLSPKDRDNRLIYPDDDFLSKSSILRDLGDEIVKIDKIWEEVYTN